MKIFTKPNLIVLATILCISMIMHPSLFKANNNDRVDIPVSVTWDHGENPADKQPENITVSLKVNDSVIKEIVLTAKDNWKGTFSGIPIRDSEGKLIDYKIQASTIEGYNIQVITEPVVGDISTSNWSKKITPASKPVHNIGNASILVANKGGHYYVWSEVSIDNSQKEAVLSSINKANLGGFGKKLTSDNTSFKSGLPASFSNDVKIEQKGDHREISFSHPRDWSLFYYGSLNITETKGAELKGTFNGSVGPDNPGTEPDNPGTDPDNPGTDPEKPGTEPDNPGTNPDNPGTEPDNPGTEPDNPGTEPDNPGTEPDNPGTEPDNPGTEPDNPGTEPDNPGTEPDNPGTNPDNPGTEPDNPGTEPDTPGTEPDNPGTEPDNPGTDPEKPGTPEKPDNPVNPDTDSNNPGTDTETNTDTKTNTNTNTKTSTNVDTDTETGITSSTNTEVKSQLDNVPKTGDDNYTNIYLCLLFGAIAGAIITGYKWRKQF